jgi:hypothetical protein
MAEVFCELYKWKLQRRTPHVGHSARPPLGLCTLYVVNWFNIESGWRPLFPGTGTPLHTNAPGGSRGQDLSPKELANIDRDRMREKAASGVFCGNQEWKKNREEFMCQIRKLRGSQSKGTGGREGACHEYERTSRASDASGMEGSQDAREGESSA